MTTLSRLGRIIGLLAIAAALAACSAVRLGYNNLNEVAYWWLDSYIDFTDEQAAPAREDLARLHQWHRTHELPRLVEVLQGMEELAGGDISPAQACAVVEQVRERLVATARHAEPAATTLAMGLAPEQLSHLERKYQTNNAKYRREWLRPAKAESVEKRFRQFADRSETIYGRLDAPQRALLRRELEQSVFDPERILAERQRRQRDALETLRKLAGQSVAFDEAQGLLRGYLARVQEAPDPEQRRYQRALLDEGCRTFAELHNSTSAEQRQSAVRRLRAYQRDLRELASRR
jgi:hypothetical protein